MTEHVPNKKKRPPKLVPNIQPPSNSQMESISSSLGSATSTSSECDLDSTVEVCVGDIKNILISPDSLIVLEQLGRGQYGIVEKVSHKDSGCQFAVKRVPLGPGNVNERKSLLMDVDILVKSTDCKNIIKFFGALIWDGDLWILMELMDCSLISFYKMAHKNRKDSSVSSTNRKEQSQAGPCIHFNESIQLGNCEICNPIPERVLGCMAADIVNALNYLYSIKVIHRDIKPSNVLINKSGIIKLCDFGISGYLVNSVASTYEAGCRPYMAPERIDPPRDRTGYDIKSDVWSFGITMLEIAIGRYPYQEARDFFEQLKRICTEQSPRLPAGRFSPAFEDFINQCLKKDYKCRPKYGVLMLHPFIQMNRGLDISEFTEKVLSNS